MEEEKVYIGAKLIRACPEIRERYTPQNGITHEAGYRVVYPDGYVSWSPQSTFEEAYRLVSDAEKKLIF